MFPSNCKAVLRAIDNTVTEYGQAKISLDERYVEFTSQFVPILKIDTEAKIICLEGTSETHVITGSVYLSSKNLLRLINIKCSILPGAENALEIPTCFSARIYKPIIKNGIFSRKKLAHKWDECTVISISLSNIVIRASRIMCEYENHLRIRIGSPVFSQETELSLELTQNGLMFGKSSRYAYTIVKLGEKEQTELADFIKLGSLELIKDLQ